MWAEKDGDNSDLDAWCKPPKGNAIGYEEKRNALVGGKLDIDIQIPQSEMPKGAVENITFNKATEGKYIFWVNQFSEVNSKGFNAEIEFNGNIYQYTYDKPLMEKENVKVATIEFINNEFTIVHHLKEAQPLRTMYNLETNKFHKVTMVCPSPNHWGDNAIGDKYYIFTLENCKTFERVKGFHIENLNSELFKLRRQLQLLADSNYIEPTEKQLAGVGFNVTLNAEVLLKAFIQGEYKLFKLKF